MKFTNIKSVLIASTLFFTCIVGTANAGLTTIGALTSNDDGSTTVINDTLNNLDWLRWDQLADKSHTQLLAEIAPTGAYAGWSIAGVNEANLFLDALYSGNTFNHGCAATVGYLPCAQNGTFTSAQYTSLLGDSFERGAASKDSVFFYDDVATDLNAGYLLLESGSVNDKYNEYGSIALTETDAFFSGNNSTGWLMYRASTAVPAPSSFAIFALALIGLSIRQFKK